MHFLGTPASYLEQVGLAIAILLGAAVLARLVLWIIDKGFTRFSRRTRTGFDDAILNAIRAPLFWLIMVAAFQIALDQISFLPEKWGEYQEGLFFVLYVLVAYLFLHRLIDRLMQWYIREMAKHTETRVDEKVLPFIRRLALILLVVIAGIVLLSHFQVDVSAMVTTLGIGSLAFALAAQNTLADTISGFVIIADRPFSLGDRIEILELDTWGDVTDIGLRSTRIRTRDNRMVVVPNSVISKSLVVNHSIPSTVYRVETHVGIAYGTNLDHARRVMIEAVRAQDWVMQEERIEALFLTYGESALIFRVRCWIKDYVETRRIMDKLNSCLYDALNEAGIEIPAPTRTLYHRVDPSDREGLAAVLREAQRNG